jgi:hypothetical protein
MSPEGAWRALYLGRHKVVWNGLGSHALYDVEADPGEARNLAESDPETLAEALRVLDKLVASLPQPGEAGPPAALDEETLRSLRSLGYVP